MNDYKAIAKKYLSSYSDMLRTERNLAQERMAQHALPQRPSAGVFLAILAAQAKKDGRAEE